MIKKIHKWYNVFTSSFLLINWNNTSIFVSSLAISSKSTASDTTGIFSPNSRLFLDTADESEWDELLPLGIFHGITTNPTLLERANQPCTIAHIQSMAKRALSSNHCNEFMCQAWGETAEKMFQVGTELSSINDET